jgi:hypothetical protein
MIEPANGRKQMNEKEISSCALPHRAENWSNIVWRKVIQQVSRLQRRIAKAVKEGRWGRVKSLTYLVSKSLLLLIRKQKLTVGFPFNVGALKVLEPYAGKLARTVLRGRKLPGEHI